MRPVLPLLIALLAGGCTSLMPDREIDALMRDYTGDVPGASLLVVREGRVVFRRGYGMADVERGVPATTSSHYRLASVTKQFTAAAVLTLAERGAISLDDRIRRTLPELPPATDAILVRHLLTHTSGLADYEDLIPESATVQLRDSDVLRLLSTQQSTLFPAGTRYRYSNSGYALLALLVERVSGRTFAEFLRDEVFAPAGMTTTVAHEEGVSTVAHRAWGHARTADGWKRDDQSLTSAVLGDGGVYSSVDELAAWIRLLDQGRFAEASVPRVETDVAGMRYGYGWRIHEHRGQPVVSHTGETRGFRNALVRLPGRKLSVVLLTNRNEGTALATALRIADLFTR